jgi:hypothetical protein
MHQQLWGYNVEEEIYLRVHEWKRLNITAQTKTHQQYYPFMTYNKKMLSGLDLSTVDVRTTCLQHWTLLPGLNKHYMVSKKVSTVFSLHCTITCVALKVLICLLYLLHAPKNSMQWNNFCGQKCTEDLQHTRGNVLYQNNMCTNGLPS